MFMIKELSVFYGKAKALDDIDLDVASEEIVSVLGPNGAGKSTLLHVISALIKPMKGSISFEGTRIDGKDAGEIVKLGIIQVPQNRQLFPAMTVFENLEMGTFLYRDFSALEFVYKLFPTLKARSKQIAATLSGGEAQMLAVGRALMSKPKFLMLDEPSLGLAPIMVQGLKRAITDINQNHVPILLVEQNAKLALELSTRTYILRVGNIVSKGLSNQYKNEEFLKSAYLGS